MKIPQAYIMQTVYGKEQKVPVEDILEYCSGNSQTAIVKTRARTTVRTTQSIFIGDVYA